MRWPNKETSMEANMETKMDANMIANSVTNYINNSKEMCAIMDSIAIQAEELTKVIKQQSFRQLLSDIKNDDIRECENVILSLEDELLSPTLDEDKEIMECEKIPLTLEGEVQDPSLVEKNELAIEVEPSLEEMQVKKKHLKLIVENVLVGVEVFNFPIDSFTFGMEEDQKVSSIDRKTFHSHKSSLD